MKQKHQPTQHPRVGVGVIVRKGGKILLGKRLGSHGSGKWSFPGGHLEFNESIEQCARREVAEEVGLTIKNLRHLAFTNDRFRTEGKHYVTLFVVADYAKGAVTLREPHKCERWEWFSPNRLPTPLFLSIRNLLKRLGNALSHQVEYEH